LTTLITVGSTPPRCEVAASKPCVGCDGAWPQTDQVVMPTTELENDQAAVGM